MFEGRKKGMRKEGRKCST